MTIFELLTKKNFGLIHGLTAREVRWFESMASDGGVDLDEGQEDFPVLNLSGIKDDDYVQFAADAQVMDANVFDEEWVAVVDLTGVSRVFNVYKVLTRAEIFA